MSKHEAPLYAGSMEAARGKLRSWPPGALPLLRVMGGGAPDAMSFDDIDF